MQQFVNYRLFKSALIGVLAVQILMGITSCERDRTDRKIPEIMEMPLGFSEMDIPEENKYNVDRWTLGKKLFYETKLSLDSSISCASCHNVQLAFSDNSAFSDGIYNRPGVRNVPTLTNIGYHPYYTREGGLKTLEMQVLVPIQEHNEFGYNILGIAERLNQDSAYVNLARAAYNREIDPYVITRALSNFERSLISGYSLYDRYTFYGEKTALSESAKKGLSLFYSERTQCSSCHSGFNFTNYAFENNGLYKEYPDAGRYRLTGLESDIARFKVPSLRNIGLTAPYMHDGSLSSLDEVLEHYNNGGQPHSNRSPLVKPLHLSKNEIGHLKSFLNSLTDEEFVNNPNFKE